MRRLTNPQEGFAVVIAIVVITAMLATGMALFAVVDQQHKQSGNERQRESALNLDEGVLYAQGFVLAGSWKSVAPGYPDCSSSQPGGPGTFCPDRNTLARFNSTSPSLANFSSADFGTNVTWVTKVRDNGGPLANAYQPSQADLPQSGTVAGTTPPLSYNCAAPCNYDANGDKQLWVQAKVTLNGHPRSIVARLQLERLTEGLPEQAVVAGHFTVSNNGNHNDTPILQGGDLGIEVRCTIGSTGCTSYQTGQVTPNPSPWPYGTTPLMSPPQLQRMRNTAIANNDYYAGCPTKGGPIGPNGVPKYSDNKYHLEGPVVWVDNCPNPPQLGNDLYTVPCVPPPGLSPKCVNTIEHPGVLIWHKGVADLSGAYTYVGLIYNANDSDDNPATAASSGDVVITSGGFGVWGAIAIDGQGGLLAGSNGLQLVGTSSAFDPIQSYGTAGLVQNTWRELNPNE